MLFEFQQNVFFHAGSLVQTENFQFYLRLMLKITFSKFVGQIKTNNLQWYSVFNGFCMFTSNNAGLFAHNSTFPANSVS